MKPLTTDNLADLIDKRHRCLMQLRDMGLKQAKLIAESDIGSLLRLIAVKNQLIGALQAIERELTPFHEQDPDKRDWPTAEARAKCAQQAKQCSQLLEEVMQLERDNEACMTERRDKVATQLQTAQAAGAARGAYQAHQAHPVAAPQALQARAGAPIAPLTQRQGQQLDLQSDV